MQLTVLPILEINSSKIILPNGIRIGMTKSELADIFGEPDNFDLPENDGMKKLKCSSECS